MEPRLLDIDKLMLLSGSHVNPEFGMCVMEAVAYVAGEPHSDRPKCASSVIGAFLRRWDDVLDDANRQRLKPFILPLVNSKASAEIERKRAWLATDWIVRIGLPACLRLSRMEKQAKSLEMLAPLDGVNSRDAAWPTIQNVRKFTQSARTSALQTLRAEIAYHPKYKHDAYAVADAAYTAYAVYDDAAYAAYDDAVHAYSAYAAYAYDAYAAYENAAHTAAYAHAAAAVRVIAVGIDRDEICSSVYNAIKIKLRDLMDQKVEPIKLSLQDSALDLVERMLSCK